MKNLKRKLTLSGAILTLIFSLTFLTPVQEFAYSKTMTLLSDCDKKERVYGKNVIIGCWGSHPDICKDKASDCKDDDEPEEEPDVE